jgi:hypothetical protein
MKILTAMLTATTSMCCLAQGTPKLDVPVPGRQLTPSDQSIWQDWFGVNSMPVQQRVEFMKRVMFTREPFLKSNQMRFAPETCHRFFGHSEYEKMQGNQIIGYFYVDPGFKWMPLQDTVEYDGFSGVNYAKQVNPQAYKMAFDIVCQRMQLKQGSSPIKISGCFVNLFVPKTPNKACGVALEMRVQTPKGNIVYRALQGKATVGDAIGASIEQIMRFARTYEDGSAPRPPAGIPNIATKVQ